MSRSLFLTGVAAAFLATGGVAYADKQSLEDENFKGGDETTFDGECEISGKVLYPDKTLITQPRDLTVGVEADGTCTGDLDGEGESTFEVELRGYKKDERFGCQSIDPGGDLSSMLNDIPGELNPEDSAGEDEVNNIAGEMTSGNPNGIMFEGRNGGELVGVFTVDDIPGFFQRCQDDGNEEVRFSATLVGNTAG